VFRKLISFFPHHTTSPATHLQLQQNTLKTASSTNSFTISNNSLGLPFTCHTANGAQHDDNNFINNTFSFLDELDNNNDDFIDLDTAKINPLVAEPDAVEQKQNGRSKTLSGFEKAEEPAESRLCSKLSSFSSKAKPLAPKIKSSVTIGVASGVEALKAIKGACQMGDMSGESGGKAGGIGSGEFSANRKLLQEIRHQQRLVAEKEEEEKKARRPSITRIISAGQEPSGKNYENK
jgi:hypothetical protein